MLVVSYDISDDKVRTKFSKFLEKYGIRLQYSVFELKNSQRLLDLVCNEIDTYYSMLFTNADSILIFNVNDNNIIKYGHAIHRDEPMVFID